MALSVYEVLRKHGQIDQNLLAQSFAENYDINRGYGPAMHRLLQAIQGGEDWHKVAASQFGGQGSYGHGAAMRVAPLGAYFADAPSKVVEQAALSALITHTHPEGVAGAIAVAIAAAIAWQMKEAKIRPRCAEFLDAILPYVPDSEVRRKIRQARDFPEGTSMRFAASVLGTGHQVSAQDTVPFALWCAGEKLDNFEEALWLTVSGLGDRDTTCAIVGGIVVLYTGRESLPLAWIEAREMLPAWPFF